MTVSITEQALIFLACVISGVLTGILYDFLKVLRITLRLGEKAIFILDSMFWVLSALILFSGLYITSGGELRWFIFLGLVLGLLFYFLTISRPLVFISLYVLRLIINFFIGAIRFILTPIMWILRFFTPKIKKLSNIIQNIQKKSLRFIQKILANLKRIGIILRKV